MSMVWERGLAGQAPVVLTSSCLLLGMEKRDSQGLAFFRPGQAGCGADQRHRAEKKWSNDHPLLSLFGMYNADMREEEPPSFPLPGDDTQRKRAVKGRVFFRGKIFLLFLDRSFLLRVGQTRGNELVGCRLLLTTPRCCRVHLDIHPNFVVSSVFIGTADGLHRKDLPYPIYRPLHL